MKGIVKKENGEYLVELDKATTPIHYLRRYPLDPKQENFVRQGESVILGYTFDFEIINNIKGDIQYAKLSEGSSLKPEITYQHTPSEKNSKHY